MRMSITVVLIFLVLFASQGYSHSATLRDDSDWWSEIPKALGANPSGGVLAVRPNHQNFQILGISVWGYTLNWPKEVVRTLGRASTIERGDAAFGRSQVCYESAGNSGRTKLIFEKGECSESFYLFEGGALFAGSDRCVSSALVNEHLKTPAGLGLGLTPAEVAKILGLPSVTSRDFLVYKYSVKVRRTKKQMEAANLPGYPPPDLYYDVNLSLLIRFRNGRSWYLCVTSTTC